MVMIGARIFHSHGVHHCAVCILHWFAVSFRDLFSLVLLMGETELTKRHHWAHISSHHFPGGPGKHQVPLEMCLVQGNISFSRDDILSLAQLVGLIQNVSLWLDNSHHVPQLFHSLLPSLFAHPLYNCVVSFTHNTPISRTMPTAQALLQTLLSFCKPYIEMKFTHTQKVNNCKADDSEAFISCVMCSCHFCPVTKHVCHSRWFSTHGLWPFGGGHISDILHVKYLHYNSSK